MTMAYLGDVEEAKRICAQIWSRYGNAVDENGDDVKKVAELQSNACYYDVAEIARDPSICSLITQQTDYKTELFGSEVTKQTCTSSVTKLASIVPQNYYNNTNSLCNLVFILPLLLFGVWKYSN
jgi:predicted restriction endonuclease